MLKIDAWKAFGKYVSFGLKMDPKKGTWNVRKRRFFDIFLHVIFDMFLRSFWGRKMNRKWVQKGVQNGSKNHEKSTPAPECDFGAIWGRFLTDFGQIWGRFLIDFRLILNRFLIDFSKIFSLILDWFFIPFHPLFGDFRAMFHSAQAKDQAEDQAKGQPRTKPTADQ